MLISIETDNMLMSLHLKRLELSKVLDEIVLLNDHIAMKLNNRRSHSLFNYILLSYCDRIQASTYTINLILPKYETRSYLENSIGILLRSCLLDRLQLIYLSLYAEDDKGTNSEKNVARDEILCDHIYYVLSYIKRRIVKKKITPKDYFKLYKKICADYFFLFNTDVKEKYFKKGPSNIELIHLNEILKDKKIKPELKFDKIDKYFKDLKTLIIAKEFKIKSIYNTINQPDFPTINGLLDSLETIDDFYALYSKYDHYSIMSNFIQENEENNFHNLVFSLIYLMHSLILIILLFEKKSKSFKKEIKKINLLTKQLWDFIPNKLP